MIDLARLMACVSDAVTHRRTLADSLCSAGGLSMADVDRLADELETLSPDRLREALDQGETLVLQSVRDSVSAEHASLLEGLAPDLAVQRTLDLAPHPPGPEESSEFTPAEARYEFVDELGRGGMGQILRARDVVLNREIALKTLLPDVQASNPQARLVAEARLTGRLEHPSIIPVYELGHLTNGEPFYTMRVITEESLESTLEQLRTHDPDAPSLQQLIQTLRQVCLAIQYAHDQGIVHRDLKPENILIGKYGEVFVIDWGIAKIMDPFPDIDLYRTGEHAPGSLVGTPLYMSPEQANGDNELVDRRTDVYALGAILYELLTLKPVFENSTVLSLLVTIIQDEPVPPSQRAPDRDVPTALEEICLRALAKIQSDRYQSAQELADDLELFLEGVKERERQEAIAKELIEEARKAHAAYKEVRGRLIQCIEDRDQLQDSVTSHAPREDRVALWEAEDQAEELRVEVEQRFGDTVSLLSQSLGFASLPEAHDALATLYWERFVEAERRNDRAMATHFEHLVRQHNRGGFTERLRGLATLTVHASPPHTDLTLAPLREHHRRLVPGGVVAMSSAPLHIDRIPHGQYLLHATAPDHAPLQLPILLDRLANVETSLRLRPRGDVPEDFVVIPAGPFLTGPARDISLSQQTVTLDEFAIKRTPVTCGEYVEFLNHLVTIDFDEAIQRSPRNQASSTSYFPFVDGKFIVPTEDADGDRWDPQWPICLIDFHDATAFAQWRSERDGYSFRLPTSLEWEKAARGIDGRIFPWGNNFDPSFCRIRESAPGKPMPAPVGTYRADTSPFGVTDMAGNISEWTSTPGDGDDTFLLRGASFNSHHVTCRLDSLLQGPAGFRHSHYGFRLVLELS